jgi:hypothetical protein
MESRWATIVTIHLVNVIKEIRSRWRDGFWLHRRIREVEK